MRKRRYLMLSNGPSLETRLWRAFIVASLAAGFALFATGAAAEPGFVRAGEPQARIYTVSTFDVGGRPIALTASGRRAYADTEMMRARVEEARELRKALPGFPQEPHVKVDMSMAF